MLGGRAEPGTFGTVSGDTTATGDLCAWIGATIAITIIARPRRSEDELKNNPNLELCEGLIDFSKVRFTLTETDVKGVRMTISCVIVKIIFTFY
jgi:hypothetical protein